MREYKFNCFLEETNEYLPVVSLVQMHAEEGLRVFPKGKDRNWLVSEGNVKLSQFTGLYDGNGNEIYEGYILLWNNPDEDASTSFEVYWEGGRYMIKEMHTGHIDDLTDTDDLMVIGNIYQNPELLTK